MAAVFQVSTEEFSSVVRRNQWSDSVTVVSVPDEEAQTSPAVIESVVISPPYEMSTEPDINITNDYNISGNTGTASISGKYSSRFNDVTKHLPFNSSDKLSSPTTTIGLGNIDEDRCIYTFIQDTTQKITLTYDVVVTYKEDGAGINDPFETVTYNVTHDILNDWVTPGQELAAHVARYAELAQSTT